MIVRILYVGDVVGDPGRRVLTDTLPGIISDHQVDCTIVNAENAASGSGLTPTLFNKILDAGADLVTMGDHTYRRSNIIQTLEKSRRIVRPANFSPQAPGKDYAIYETRTGKAVAVFCLLGGMYMRIQSDNPFLAADRVLNAIPYDCQITFCEVHAEATSEKKALGWYLDGRLSAVVGTHTHVPTADECILPQGTAYITDIGMTGPHDSVLGRKKDRVIKAMTTNITTPFDVADGDPRLNGVLVEVDGSTGKAHTITRIQKTA